MYVGSLSTFRFTEQQQHKQVKGHWTSDEKLNIANFFDQYAHNKGEEREAKREGEKRRGEERGARRRKERGEIAY